MDSVGIWEPGMEHVESATPLQMREVRLREGGGRGLSHVQVGGRAGMEVKPPVPLCPQS